MTFYVHRGSGQARVYPRRWLSLSSRAKTFTLKGRHRRFVDDSAFHTSLRRAPLLGEQQKWYQHILQKVQNLVPHVCVCVFFPFILDIKFVGRISRGHTGGRPHRIAHPPSFCGACLIFSREKDAAIPFPRHTNDLIVLHPLRILMYCCRAVCVCVCFLPIHSGHQVRWTYQPGSHRRKVTQDFSSTFFLRCAP